MKDSNIKIGIIALSQLKGIGPAFIKKVVTNESFKSNNLIKEIKEITSSNKKLFDEIRIYNFFPTDTGEKISRTKH